MRSLPYRHQPLKFLYIAWELFSTSFIRVPLWILHDLLPALRPRQSWSLRRCLSVRLIRRASWVMSRQTGKFLSTPDHLKLEPNSGGVWILPLPLSYLQKPLSTWARAAQVEPIRIPGYWQTSSPNLKAPPDDRPKPDEKVIYHLHGGGFTYCSAHPSDTTANIPRSLLQLRTLNIARSFSVEYRLASTKPFDVVHPFPTALIDCLSGYHYLVHDVGYREENIIVVGDSAGGNLALALTRYLRALDSPKLKQPGALLLLSPWVDLSDSHTTPGSSILTNSASDYDIYEPSPSWPQTAYLQPHGYGIADFNEYISPASLLLGVRSKVVGSYQGWPKTCLAAGGAELLFDEIRTLKEDMENDMGENLLYIEKKDASHDWLLWEWHEPERGETLKDIEKWLVTL